MWWQLQTKAAISSCLKMGNLFLHGRPALLQCITQEWGFIYFLTPRGRIERWNVSFDFHVDYSWLFTLKNIIIMSTKDHKNSTKSSGGVNKPLKMPFATIGSAVNCLSHLISSQLMDGSIALATYAASPLLSPKSSLGENAKSLASKFFILKQRHIKWETPQSQRYLSMAHSIEKEKLPFSHQLGVHSSTTQHSDFQPLSSLVTHKLTTEILQHTKNSTTFLPIWQNWMAIFVLAVVIFFIWQPKGQQVSAPD